MTSNLRVIYDNVFDTCNSLLVSSTASAYTTATNLKLDMKNLVWRSALTSSTIGTTKANLSLGFPTHVNISCIIFAYTNFSAEAVVRIKLYSGPGVPNIAGTVDEPTIGNAAGNTLLYDSGGNDYRLPLVRYADIDSFNWGYDPLGLTGYENRRGYSVLWLPEAARVPFNSMAIQLYDAGCTDHFIEISRIIMGNYWSPRYNTGFGLSVNTKDLSTSDRNEAGDLITSSGAVYNSMSFDLQYMDYSDRNMLNKLVRNKGTKKPIFVSLFPENDTDYVKENMHQMYGKLAQTPEISHPVFETYSSRIEIEEI